MKIMVSYNRGEWGEVENIVNQIRAQQIPLWIDCEALAAGADWRSELLSVARTADAFIPFLSDRYVNSAMCRMELLMARAFKRPILPIMIEECWDALQAFEETKFVSDLTVARIGAEQLYGYNVSKAELVDMVIAKLKRIMTPEQSSTEPNVYLSYPSLSARFATDIHQLLLDNGLHPWIATRNSSIGEDWRETQIETLTNCKVLVTIASAGLLSDSNFLRTEILISEAIGHLTFTVEDPELQRDSLLKAEVYQKLERDPAFSRLVERQWYSPDEIGKRLLDDVHSIISR